MLTATSANPTLIPTGNALAPRSHFPGAQSRAYLNCAGVGLVPTPVQAQVMDVAKRLMTDGTVGYFDHYGDLMGGPRAAAARLLGAPLETVGVVTSISEAISQIAWWRRPQAGENVVLIDIDAAAVTYPWLRVAEETGADVRFVRATDNPAELCFEDIARLVDERTSVICVSHVQWITGVRFDLKALADLAHAHGAILVVDAMHSVGVEPITTEILVNVDYLVTGAFKWMCAWAGAGVVYVHPKWVREFRPVMVGSRTTDPAPPFDEVDATTIQLPDDARRFEYGSSIALSRVAFAASIDYILDLDLGRIRRHVQALGDRIIGGGRALGGVSLTPEAHEARGGIVSLAFPDVDMRALYEALLKRNVVISLRRGALRFAPHFFNDAEDVERALAGLRSALSEGG